MATYLRMVIPYGNITPVVSRQDPALPKGGILTKR
jgi:hypothetical protein